MHDILSRFSPILRDWFLDFYGQPTDIQEKSWKLISEGNHSLITSPTGSGKTLAAFFWAINRILEEKKGLPGVRVLYISPLKALNSDVRRNLEEPLGDIEKYFRAKNLLFPEIKVAVRSGDTEYSERRAILRSPPHIFITTPESLNILLSSKSAEILFRHLDVVILDEIHATIGTKRGTYLMSAVERLALKFGEFQRIGISATVRPLQSAADFIGGFKMETSPEGCNFVKRNVSIVESTTMKIYKISVEYPDDLQIDKSGDPNTDWFRVLAKSFREVINRNKSTIFFAESRRLVEKLTRIINEDSGHEFAYSHHGSLSKEIRKAVEEKLKSGELPAIVSTSSLELGIDIGSIDEIVLVQTPYSISSALQRIGRSGHKVGKTSVGIFHPIHIHDYINSAVCAHSAKLGEIEELTFIQKPLDVLSQIILSMTLFEERKVEELFNEVRTCFDYRNLERKEFDLVIEMLAGRYADSRIRELKPRLLFDRINGTAKARENVAPILYLSGGVIPDRGYFNLRVSDTKTKIGELDEEFVWERSIGDSFPFGNRIWRIRKITHNDVEVEAISKSSTLIPFWNAEERNRSFYFSEKIGQFLEFAEENLEKDNFELSLESDYCMSRTAAQNLIQYLKRQREATNASLPHRNHVLIEYFKDPVDRDNSRQVIIHTFWGGEVNKPFAYSLSRGYEEKYRKTLEVYANNDCIMMNLTDDFSSDEIFTIVHPDNIEKFLRQKLESTGFFGSKFRENAQRSLLLTKSSFRERMPLWFNRLRSKKLLESVAEFPDFPVILETWRTCILDEFDIDSLKLLLNEIETGKIKITEVSTRIPSPFSEEVVWRETNFLMYQDDSPHSKLQSRISEDLLTSFLNSPHLKPKFSEEILKTFQEKLHRTFPGYSPDSPEELLLFVKDRLFIPSKEWETLLAAIERDHKIPEEELVQKIQDSLITIDEGRMKGVASKENSHKIYDALKNPGSKFFPEWLRFYGPIPNNFIRSVFDLQESRFEEILENLIRSEFVVIDHFRDGESAEAEMEICEIENFEILLRIRRRASRSNRETLPIGYMNLYLAKFQGLVERGNQFSDFQKRLEKLLGYPARPELWESEFLPARLEPYFTTWLDSAMRENELAFFGAGNQRFGFTFLNELDIFSGRNPDNGPTDSNEKTTIFNFLKKSKGRFSSREISAAMENKNVMQSVWELFWEGRISNDDYSAMRKGILNKFNFDFEFAEPRTGRSGFQRWKSQRNLPGNWFCLSNDDIFRDADAIQNEKDVRDRIRQLFMRYGILFRELLWNESINFRWSAIIRTLLRMELSGEVVTGQFFSDIPGLQFISREGIQLLEEGLSDTPIFWMNACDPASLCGIRIDSIRQTLPQRLSSTHLVFHGATNVLRSSRKGRHIEILCGSEDTHLLDYLKFFHSLLTREFQPYKSISVEKINSKTPEESEFKTAFLKFGFENDRNRLILRRKFD